MTPSERHSTRMATPSPHPLRLAMWSGPRNISTAMMRAWGNRPDCAVVDEPLYAHYLHATGRIHPGRAETLAAGPTDVTEAIAGLLGPVPGGKAVFYQKQMTHHLLPGIDRSWMRALTNCFLIRKPADVLSSLVKHVSGSDSSRYGISAAGGDIRSRLPVDESHAAGD